MGKVHRAVMSRIAEPVQAVFLDTPAGFELNADHISARAVQYFKRHLNLDLHVASFKSAATATPSRVQTALRTLRQAHYIFAGPGSPTYAVDNWRETAIIQAVAQRLAAGAHLVLASAAAIAMGRYALPVYEIYKVGATPHWVDGLDLLEPYGLELAVVPHWNNAEGSTHDTRYCFVGEPRINILERSLPDSATILGIDEYTACTLDLHSSECLVMGAGQVTIRQKGRDEKCYPAGTSFGLDELKTGRAPGESGGPPEAGVTGLPVDWTNWPDPVEEDVEAVDPFIDLLVWVRGRLRTNKQWNLADEIRQRLVEMDIILEDGQAETTWKWDRGKGRP